MSNNLWNVVQVQFANQESEYPHVTTDVIASCNTYALAQEYLNDRIAYLTDGYAADEGWEYLGMRYNAYQLENEYGAILQLSIEPSTYTEN